MQAKPFLKWVGGKRQLVDELRARTPKNFGRYYEPFVGGGALFFELRPKLSFLADSNSRLVRTYKAVRDEVEAVIALLSTYPYEQAFFERLRGVDIDRGTDVEVAAWFIYINRAGFNGLYRVNAKGQCNVPFGRYDNPTICDAENLRACSAALKGVRVWNVDFEHVCDITKPGDFVYLDPPYAPLTATASFTAYNADRFGRIDQVRVRDAAKRMIERGVHVLVSNSSAPLIRKLYGEPPFAIDEVSATRSVNSKTDRRGAISEVMIRGVIS